MISSVYLPCVEDCYDADYIVRAFERNQLATVCRIGMKKTQNADPYSNTKYNRVWVDIHEWNDNEISRNFVRRLTRGFEARIVHHSGEELWWPVHINYKRTYNYKKVKFVSFELPMNELEHKNTHTNTNVLTSQELRNVVEQLPYNELLTFITNLIEQEDQSMEQRFLSEREHAPELDLEDGEIWEDGEKWDEAELLLDADEPTTNTDYDQMWNEIANKIAEDRIIELCCAY